MAAASETGPKRQARRVPRVTLPRSEVLGAGVVPYLQPDDVQSLRRLSSGTRQDVETQMQRVSDQTFCRTMARGTAGCTRATQYGNRSCLNFCLQHMHRWVRDVWRVMEEHEGVESWGLGLLDPTSWAWRWQLDVTRFNQPVEIDERQRQWIWPGMVDVYSEFTDLAASHGTRHGKKSSLSHTSLADDYGVEMEYKQDEQSADKEQRRTEGWTAERGEELDLRHEEEMRQIDVRRALDVAILQYDDKQLQQLVDRKKALVWPVLDYHMQRVTRFDRMTYRIKLELGVSSPDDVLGKHPDMFRSDRIVQSSPWYWTYTIWMRDHVREGERAMQLLNRIRDGLFRIHGTLYGDHEMLSFRPMIERVTDRDGYHDMMAAWAVLDSKIKRTEGGLRQILIDEHHDVAAVDQLSSPVFFPIPWAPLLGRASVGARAEAVSEDAAEAAHELQLLTFRQDLLRNLTHHSAAVRREKTGEENRGPDYDEYSSSDLYHEFQTGVRQYLRFYYAVWACAPDADPVALIELQRLEHSEHLVGLERVEVLRGREAQEAKAEAEEEVAEQVEEDWPELPPIDWRPITDFFQPSNRGSGLASGTLGHRRRAVRR